MNDKIEQKKIKKFHDNIWLDGKRAIDQSMGNQRIFVYVLLLDTKDLIIFVSIGRNF